MNKMELSPNKLVLLLKIRRAYMMDDLLRNGFKSKNELGAHVLNSYDPSRTLKDFINELMEEHILFIQGSLKLDIDKCDRLIAENEHFLLLWNFAKEKAILIEDPFN